MQKEENKTQNPTLVSLDSSRLRQARLRCEITIEEAARQTSLNKMTLQRYESGDIRATSPDRLLSASEQLLLSPDLSLPPSRLGPRLLACLQFFSKKNSAGQA